MRRFKGEYAQLSFNKWPIYTHDGASAKFSTKSQEMDNSVPYFKFLVFYVLLTTFGFFEKCFNKKQKLILVKVFASFLYIFQQNENAMFFSTLTVQ